MGRSVANGLHSARPENRAGLQRQGVWMRERTKNSCEICKSAKYERSSQKERSRARVIRTLAVFRRPTDQQAHPLFSSLPF